MKNLKFLFLFTFFLSACAETTSGPSTLEQRSSDLNQDGQEKIQTLNEDQDFTNTSFEFLYPSDQEIHLVILTTYAPSNTVAHIYGMRNGQLIEIQELMSDIGGFDLNHDSITLHYKDFGSGDFDPAESGGAQEQVTVYEWDEMQEQYIHPKN